MSSRINDPLFGAPPERVQLGAAPLVRVLAQVRFSKIIKISEEQHIGDFQEVLRQEYPHLAKDAAQALEFEVNQGAVSTKSTNEVIWRLFDAQKIWRVSLAPEFISIETAVYTSRDDFLSRTERVLNAVSRTLKPALATRVGFRYLNRLEGLHNLGDLEKLIHPELVGMHSGALRSHIVGASSQIEAATREGRLLARWGLTPAGASHDPNMAPPANETSWVLDIDSFKENNPVEEGFRAAELSEMVGTMANRAYAFFRWSAQDEFLRRFGGNI